MEIIGLAASLLFVVIPVIATIGYMIYVCLKILFDGIRSGLDR